MPSARSRESAPVETAPTETCAASLIRITAALAEVPLDLAERDLECLLSIHACSFPRSLVVVCSSSVTCVCARASAPRTGPRGVQVRYISSSIGRNTCSPRRGDLPHPARCGTADVTCGSQADARPVDAERLEPACSRRARRCRRPRRRARASRPTGSQPPGATERAHRPPRRGARRRSLQSPADGAEEGQGDVQLRGDGPHPLRRAAVRASTPAASWQVVVASRRARKRRSGHPRDASGSSRSPAPLGLRWSCSSAQQVERRDGERSRIVSRSPGKSRREASPSGVTAWRCTRPTGFVGAAARPATPVTETATSTPSRAHAVGERRGRLVETAPCSASTSRHAELALLHLVRVGDDGAEEDVARARHVGQPRRDEPTGARLGRAERPAARAAEVEDDLLHAALVRREHVLLDRARASPPRARRPAPRRPARPRGRRGSRTRARRSSPPPRRRRHPPPRARARRPTR